MILLLFLITAHSFFWSSDPTQEERHQRDVQRSIDCLKMPDGAAAMRCLGGEKVPSEPLKMTDDECSDAVVPVAAPPAEPQDCGEIIDDYTRWWCFSGLNPNQLCSYDNTRQVQWSMNELRGFDCRTTSLEICFTDGRLAQTARNMLACHDDLDDILYPCYDEPSEPLLLP